MDRALINTLIALVTFILTLSFSFSYKIFNKTRISSILKCIAGGIILSALIFHIIPDLYEDKDSFVAPFSCGISFLLLFCIDKLFLCTEGCHDELPKNAGIKKAIIFVIALSVHSFLEGLGCATKTEASLKSYLIGLWGHKWIEAFALGVSISKNLTNNQARWLIFMYSCLTPLGILIGHCLLKIECLSPLLNGLASGSFFYIGFVEMLISELENVKKKEMQKRMSAVTMAFIFMSVFLYFMGMAEKKYGKNV